MRKIRHNKGRKAVSTSYEYTGVHTSQPISIQLIVYNQEQLEEFTEMTVTQAIDILAKPQYQHHIKWLNIHGLHDAKLIQTLAEKLELPSYMVGDILNVSRRSKMEEFNQILFFSIKSVLQEENGAIPTVEQISFVLKDNLLVSFQEKKSDFFGHIRERIKQFVGPVRNKQADYLLYSLLDAVMDNFYITIENNELVIEKLLLQSKLSHHIQFLEKLENEREYINLVKRAIVPLREALFNLKTSKHDDDLTGIQNANLTFFSRLHQKCLELLEQIEYDLAMLDSASNIFFSMQNQRMNLIMKTLTIVSVIFIPLTFISGIYGMNFHVMPELANPNGYYITLMVMLILAVAMVVYFKLKKWF